MGARGKNSVSALAKVAGGAGKRLSGSGTRTRDQGRAPLGGSLTFASGTKARRTERQTSTRARQKSSEVTMTLPATSALLSTPLLPGGLPPFPRVREEALATGAVALGVALASAVAVAVGLADTVAVAGGLEITAGAVVGVGRGVGLEVGEGFGVGVDVTVGVSVGEASGLAVEVAKQRTRQAL